MKLLILTQKVDIDDDILGFFHGWILEFAKHCEQVTVICLFKGRYELPDNVKILSLGKEGGSRKSVKSVKSKVCKVESLPFTKGVPVRGRAFNFQFFDRIKYLFRFYKYIWQERKNYDGVFVHMNQIYVILGGLFWRMWRKRISLWYAHGYVPFSLLISEKFLNTIFTSTKSGCRLESDKIKIVGQGIDASKFKKDDARIVTDNIFRILFVGRISPIKDIETLIEAIDIICADQELSGINFQVDIVGGVGLKEQEEYFDKLKRMVSEKNLGGVVNFVGPVPSYQVVDYLKKADFFVNTSHTGSLDKVILEAMACEVPIGSCNESLLDILGKYKDELMFEKGGYVDLAKIIKKIIILDHDGRKELGRELREIVIQDHSLNGLIKNILNKINSQ